jgi:hypothetical protein
MIESELTWHNDHETQKLNFRFHSQKLVPVKGAQFPYKHPAYWIVKRNVNLVELPSLSVRTYAAPFPPLANKREPEQFFNNDLELALFIAELEPAVWR